MNKPEHLPDVLEYERLVAAHAGDSMTLTDAEGRVLWVNAAFSRLTGYQFAEVAGRKPGEILQGQDTDTETVTRIGNALRARQPMIEEILNHHKSGRRYWIEMNIVPIFDGQGRHTHFLSVERDITARKRFETESGETLAYEKQREAERKILGQVAQWMYSTKSLEELLQVTRRAMSTLIPEAEGSLYIYSDSRDTLEVASAWGDNRSIDPLDPDQCWALRRGRAYSFGTEAIEFPCAHVGSEQHPFFCLPIVADGETIGMLHLRFTSLRIDRTGQRAIEVFIRQRWSLAMLCAEQMSLAIANVRLRQVLLDRAVRDPLTNLWNRRWLTDTTHRMLTQARTSDSELSLLSVDVDHFKSFNDRFGHDAGDSVLREVAAVLIDVARDRGAVARSGGEEFTILCPGLDHAAAMKLAEDARTALTVLKLRYDGRMLPNVTASIGVASFAPGMSGDALIRAADGALYRAKAAGRDRVVSALDAPSAKLSGAGRDDGQDRDEDKRGREGGHTRAKAGGRTAARHPEGSPGH